MIARWSFWEEGALQGNEGEERKERERVLRFRGTVLK